MFFSSRVRRLSMSAVWVMVDREGQREAGVVVDPGGRMGHTGDVADLVFDRLGEGARMEFRVALSPVGGPVDSRHPVGPELGYQPQRGEERGQQRDTRHRPPEPGFLVGKGAYLLGKHG